MTAADPSPVHEGLLDLEEAVERTIVPSGDGADQGPFAKGTFMKIGTAMATLVALLVATYVVPALESARPWTRKDPAIFWNLVGREFLGDAEVAAQAEERLEALEALAVEAAEAEDEPAPFVDKKIVDVPTDGGLPPYEAHPDDEEPVPQAIENPELLEVFYEALAQTDAGYAGATTRVSHWGDSAIALDHVSSTMRELMQRRFGDAGHGFHLLARPNKSYLHKGVSFRDGDAWERCYIINACRKDGHYGFGGTTVWSGPGARTKFATSDREAYGRSVSTFEFWYRAQPGGGKVELTVDDTEPVTVSTAAEVEEDRWERLEMADGAHTITVRVASGKVRAYGVTLERDVPGVVWDGLAQLGAFTSRMLYFDEAHLRGQVDHRAPALIVFQFGGNDLTLKEGKLESFRTTTANVVRRFVGEPGSRACLLVSPVDHGQRVGGRIESVEAMATVTQIQREVAKEAGCAFFDVQAAMGGANSVALWRAKNLIAGDLSHLSPTGQRLLGRMLYFALMQGYRAYRKAPA